MVRAFTGTMKNQIFSQLILHNNLSTNYQCFRCNLATDSIYGRCNHRNEDIFHCLGECMVAKWIWDMLSFINTTYFTCAHITQWVISFTLLGSSFLFLVALQWIWRQHNLIIFSVPYEGDAWIIRKIYGMVGKCMETCKRKSKVQVSSLVVTWQNQGNILLNWIWMGVL